MITPEIIAMAQPFIGVASATIFLILAHIVMGAQLASTREEFSFKKLVSSLGNYMWILVTAGLIFLAGYFGDGVLNVEEGSIVALKSLASLGLAVYGGNLAVKVGSQFMEITGIKKDKGEE